MFGEEHSRSEDHSLITCRMRAQVFWPRKLGQASRWTRHCNPAGELAPNWILPACLPAPMVMTIDGPQSSRLASSHSHLLLLLPSIFLLLLLVR